ncbi:MAG TPA: hypothetical protein DCM87_04165 [Planctomycetes bacterium]|nr:hypothetical protein [Planctomycetota bacterium]
MKRRGFLMLLAGGAACARGAVRAGGAAPAGPRVACQEWVVPGETLGAKAARLAAWGFDGIELSGAPLRGAGAAHVAALGRTARAAGIAVSAVCGGVEGALAHHDAAVRARAAASVRALLAVAGGLGAAGVLVAAGMRGDGSRLGEDDRRRVLADLLPALGEAAAAEGTMLLLEPVRGAGASFPAGLAEAAALIRGARGTGLGLAADCYHARHEEGGLAASLQAVRDCLRYVHVCGEGRRVPDGSDALLGASMEALAGCRPGMFLSIQACVAGDAAEELPLAAAAMARAVAGMA